MIQVYCHNATVILIDDLVYLVWQADEWPT